MEREISQAASEHSSTTVGGSDKIGERLRWTKFKRSETPVGAWFEEYSIRTSMPLRDLAKRISLSNLGVRGKFGLSSLSKILQNAPEALKLSEEETSTLAEAVAQTIEQRIASGHNYSINSGVNVRKVQAGLDCQTFNGVQAAEILGTNRQHIFTLRQSMGLPILMTQEHIDQLKLKFDSTRVTRERRRKTLTENKEESNSRILDIASRSLR